MQIVHGLRPVNNVPARLPYILPWRANCAVVRCGPFDSSIRSISDLLRFCESHYIPRIGDSSNLDLHAKWLLDADEVYAIGKAYERNPTTTNWYFEVFVGERLMGGSVKLKNSLVEPLVSPKHGAVRGDVLLVKNGPKNGNWDEEFTLKEVTEVLWWYHKSGRDVTEVFGERELVRFMNSM
jgi:hypothetical protein